MGGTQHACPHVHLMAHRVCPPEAVAQCTGFCTGLVASPLSRTTLLGGAPDPIDMAKAGLLLARTHVW